MTPSLFHHRFDRSSHAVGRILHGVTNLLMIAFLAAAAQPASETSPPDLEMSWAHAGGPVSGTAGQTVRIRVSLDDPPDPNLENNRTCRPVAVRVPE
jgi:hypothetical protein